MCVISEQILIELDIPELNMPFGDRKQPNTQACMKTQFLPHRQEFACALQIKID